MAFDWWADSGMTVPLTRLDFVRTATPAAVDAKAYFGNPIAGTKLQNSTSPGSAPLQITVDDSAPGSGVEAAGIKLAASVGGLAGATAGAPLGIGTTLFAGPAVTVYVRVTSGITALGDYDDVSLLVPDRLETAV